MIAPETSAIDDVRALLGFAWQGGFLGAALLGLARTAFSDYRKLRTELGLAHYAPAEILDLLDDRGFRGERAVRNFGHNPKRMTFVGHAR